MGRLNDQTRGQKEAAIQAAMDRLLRGEVPPGGKCDVKTLAATSTRAALYSTYLHLKQEFERREQLREAGVIADPREAQIGRLKDRADVLQQRVVDRDEELAALKVFRTEAVSRLAAQHEEIVRLRAALADPSNVHDLSISRSRVPRRS